MRITGVQVRWVCEECNGKGYVPAPLPYCRICQRSYTHTELAFFNNDSGWDELLPCKHRQHELSDQQICIDCSGRGWGQGWVPLEAIRDSIARGEAIR